MNLHNHNVNPLGALTSGPTPATSTSSGSSSSGTPVTSGSDTLDADSFITLLTTELQAQDPLNPLDPTQFVSQLTDLNSLQELIQIRTDLDTLVSSASAGATGGTTGATNGSTTAAARASTVGNGVPGIGAQHSASSVDALSSLQSQLKSSISSAPSKAAALYSKLSSLSKLF